MKWSLALLTGTLSLFATGVLVQSAEGQPRLGFGISAGLEHVEFPVWMAPLTGARDGTASAGPRLSFEESWGNGVSLDFTIQGYQSQGDDFDLALRDFLLAHNGVLTTEIGLGVQAWSFFELIHPLDPVETLEFRLDLEDPGANYGLPYAQISHYGDGGGLIQLLLASNERDLDRFVRDKKVTALRHVRPVGNANLSAQIISGPDDLLRYGIGANTSVGAMIWVLEAEQVETAGSALLSRDAGERVLLGGRRALGQGAQIDFGYYHNGPGLNGSEWDVLTAQVNAVSEAIGLGDFRGAALLAEYATATQTRFLRRDYLFASYSSADRFEVFDVTTGAYLGVADNSALAFAEMNFGLSESLSLRVNAATGIGRSDSEFARRPASIGLLLTKIFGGA